MSAIANRLRDYILSRYLSGETPANLTDDIPLRTSGVLDSLATLNLISFIEQEFGIEIEAHETDVDNFDRLRDMAAFIERKQAAARERA